jgi:arylsulfatase A
MDEDPGETTNLYFEHPEIVKKRTQKITKIVEDGRTTAGVPQDYVKDNWKQLTWIKP